MSIKETKKEIIEGPSGVYLSKLDRPISTQSLKNQLESQMSRFA
jgi:hypothetical protein